MRRLVLSLMTIGLLLTSGSIAQAQFRTLARRVPDSANALVLINVKKLHDSPLGKRANWAVEHQKMAESGLINIPPDATHFLMASETDFETLNSKWSMAIVELAEAPELDEVAKKFGGTVEDVGDAVAVALPNESFLVKFSDSTWGTLAPASRQSVAQWVRRGQTRFNAPLSPYLDEALGYAQDVGTEIIIAIDLEHVISEAEVLQNAKDTQQTEGASIIKKAGLKPEDVAGPLASLRGVTLGIVIGEQPFGSIKVDFAKDISALAPIAKPLLLYVLAEKGAMIDEFADWKVEVGDKQFRLSGNLSESGRRKILSLVDAPLSTLAPSPQHYDDPEPSASDIDPKAYASKQYFDAVQGFLKDFRGRSGTGRTIGQYGVWLDRYARKIDGLPLLNVDPIMVDYGAYVGQQLRNASAAIKGIGIRSRAGQVNAVSGGGAYDSVAGGYVYDGYMYGGYHIGNAGNRLQRSLAWQQQQRTQVKVQEKARGASAARSIMQDIDNQTLQVRRQMVEKFQIEF